MVRIPHGVDVRELRKHFWHEASRGAGALASPVKNGLTCTTPALVNSRVGSPMGIRDELGMTRCPFDS